MRPRDLAARLLRLDDPKLHRPRRPERSPFYADPYQDPKGRYLAKGSIPDHGEERVSSGHRDNDYLEWIARLTSHIPDRGTQFVHYYGTCSNAHRGVARRRESFVSHLDARRVRG